MRNHKGAVNYDMMTKTQYRLSMVGTGSFFWSDVADFVEHLPIDSAVARELDKDVAEWRGGACNASILADICDVLNILRTEFECVHSAKGSRPDMPEPYPRPHAAKRRGGGQCVGSDPIPIRDFDAWWAEHAKGGEK